MLLAVLAGIATLVVIAIIAFAFVRRSSKRDADVVERSHSVGSMIDTYGVTPEVHQTAFGAHAPAQVERRDAPTTAAGAAIEGRFVAMGVLAAAVFGSLAAKLWSMQVLQQQTYATQASSNIFRTVYTPAPRGIIYDAGGIVLAGNRQSYAVLVDADVVDDHDVVQRLSTLLGIPLQVVRQRILDTSVGAQNYRVVSDDATLRNVAFISEHPSVFKGVHCEMRSYRQYPYGALAAHVLGYIQNADENDLANPRPSQRDSLRSGDLVGKGGIEGYYDELLAGDHGTRTVLTDATGGVQEVVSETKASRGSDVFLTLRAPVQYVADTALRSVVAPEGRIGDNGGVGSAAAVVCLDATNGEVIAMSSFPSFTPESFVGGISSDVWEEWNPSEDSDAISLYPLMNRVIAGSYPAASTFKAFTSMAALANGVTNAGAAYECTGTWTGFGEAYAQRCWNRDGHGWLDLVGGIAHSCDTVFYEIAKTFYENRDALGETAMQDYIANQYGFGRRSGIDLAGEVEGRVPTPEWKAENFRNAPEEGQWQGGDLTNMAIGQGYVLVTPLQMAVGYCGIATGAIYRPHLLREVRNSLGQTVYAATPELMLEPRQQPEHIALVREGLREVMEVNSYDRFFSDISQVVAGKTGTAQVTGKKDFSWFACYAPVESPKYVVACLVEEGQTAANCTIPIAAKVLKAAFDYDEGKLGEDSVQPVTGRFAVDPSVGEVTDDYERED